jgi:glycopeptide antibiotics resistance protein
MATLTYIQFLDQLQSVKGFEKGSQQLRGFAPYLAFALIHMAGIWSIRLSLWDKGLSPKMRPWIYLGLIIGMILILVLPQFFVVETNEKPTKTAAVLTVPIVPFDPILVPDTLLINQSLYPILYEK